MIFYIEYFNRQFFYSSINYLILYKIIEMRIVIYFLIIVSFCSCEDEQKQEKKLNIITGQIIDSPKSVNFSDYTLTARSIFGTVEKDVAYTQLNEDGTFRMEYYSDGNYIGNNLRISFVPDLFGQQKFEFLPYGTSWFKNFYISDSARAIVKLNNTLSDRDTLLISTNPNKYILIGPTTNNTLLEIRTSNLSGYLYYRVNNLETNSYYFNPTGDPIVDTITLDINP